MSEINTPAPAAPVADTSEADSNGQENQIESQAPLTPKMIKALKLKIDGQEYDEQLPFEVDENNKEQIEYLKRHLQMSKVSQKRMNEAAMTRKQAESFIEALQNDPMKVLSNPKLMGEEKFAKLAEEFLSKKLQDQMMSPEERNHRDREEKLKRYEEQEQSSKKDAETKQIEELQNHYQESYTKTITEALETSSLPKNPFTVKRMAQLLQQNIKHGLDLEPKYLAQLVKEDYQKELASLIGNSNPEQIIAMFGEDTVNKLRKHDLAAMKAKLGPQHTRITQQMDSGNAPAPRKQSWQDWTEEQKKK